jgi:hypothetical protein
MNERIKQLAEQAELNATLLFNKDKLEKFAELIVRECANLFDKDEMELSLTERTIHKTIKEHFGFKE